MTEWCERELCARGQEDDKLRMEGPRSGREHGGEWCIRMWAARLEVDGDDWWYAGKNMTEVAGGRVQHHAKMITAVINQNNYWAKIQTNGVVTEL